MARSQYRKPKFPRGAKHIFLVDDNGVEDGPWPVASFMQTDEGNGSWVAQTPAGHPCFLRIERQEGDEIWTRDGAGKLFHLRIRAAQLA